MLQIIGYKSCNQTKKAIRFCKERSIDFQFVDLNERELSLGEWNKIFSSLRDTSLIDTESKYYKKEGYSWREYNEQEELMEHPQLLKTPLLKYKDKVVVGFDQKFILSLEQ